MTFCLFRFDSIYRYTGGAEVSLPIGPYAASAVGYQPDTAEEMGVLRERITRHRLVPITPYEGGIHVPAGWLTRLRQPPLRTRRNRGTEPSRSRLWNLSTRPPLTRWTPRQSAGPLVVDSRHYDCAALIHPAALSRTSKKNIIAITGTWMNCLKTNEYWRVLGRSALPVQPFFVAEYSLFSG